MAAPTNQKLAQTNGKTAVIERSKGKQVLDVLESRKDEIAKLCGATLTPDQLFKISVNCIAKNPSLAECTVASLVQCIVTFAEWGLQPNPALGLCYMVPYKHREDGKVVAVTASPMLGYRGMMELTRRSGQVAMIEAELVRKGEVFIDTRGFNPVFEHHPQWAPIEDNGNVIGAYAMVTFKDGYRQVAKMSKSEIVAIQNRSKAKDGPWVTDWAEMAKKTVVRRLMKYVSFSPAVADALEKDQDELEEAEFTRQIQMPANLRAPRVPPKALPEEAYVEQLEMPELRPEPVPVEAVTAEIAPQTPPTNPQPQPPKADILEDVDGLADLIIAQIRAAKDVASLKILANKANQVPPDRAEEIGLAYAERKKELQK